MLNGMKLRLIDSCRLLSIILTSLFDYIIIPKKLDLTSNYSHLALLHKFIEYTITHLISIMIVFTNFTIKFTLIYTRFIICIKDLNNNDKIKISLVN
ncbi:unnamed protein product [Schistosoma margrebowiei]|uniref:Uncharacterized protein n=1 Tax=Schistosoma margrebowiei TaxID=48269 RepID=A0A183N8T5_9TREM|nr:unnamed protein product [Schistosoma margrebowiei]